MGDKRGAIAAFDKYVALEKAPDKQRFVEAAKAELAKLDPSRAPAPEPVLATPPAPSPAPVAAKPAAVEDAASLRAQADELRKENRLADAAPAYKRAIAADRGNLDLYNDLGNVYFALKQYGDAANAFGDATHARSELRARLVQPGARAAQGRSRARGGRRLPPVHPPQARRSRSVLRPRPDAEDDGRRRRAPSARSRSTSAWRSARRSRSGSTRRAPSWRRSRRRRRIRRRSRRARSRRSRRATTPRARSSIRSCSATPCCRRRTTTCGSSIRSATQRLRDLKDPFRPRRRDRQSVRVGAVGLGGAAAAVRRGAGRLSARAGAAGRGRVAALRARRGVGAGGELDVGAQAVEQRCRSTTRT